MLLPGPDARREGDLAFDGRVVEQAWPRSTTPIRPGPASRARPARALVVPGRSHGPVRQEHVAELVGLLPDGQRSRSRAITWCTRTRPQEFLQQLLGSLDTQPARAHVRAYAVQELQAAVSCAAVSGGPRW